MRLSWMLVLAGTLSLSLPTYCQQRIHGIVTDAGSGLPIVGATVRVTAPPATHATDGDGAFVFVSRPSGPTTLTVTHVGYRSWSQDLTVSGTDLDLRISLVAEPLRALGLDVFATRAESRSAPVSFSELPRPALEARYTVQDVPVLLSDLPSSTFTSESGNGMGYTYLRIRGFDQRRLAVMVNGIPQNEPEDHNVYWLDFADLLGSVEEIQVQRGAGSAFYGPPAIGGSINIVTGDFADRKGLTVSQGFGSFHTRKTSVAFGSGLVDHRFTVYARLSAMNTGGYREHSGMSVWQYYLTGTRYDPGFTTRITLYGAPVEDELAYYGLPRFTLSDRTARRKNYSFWSDDDTAYTYTQTRRVQEREQFFQPHYEIMNEWEISERWVLNSALFHVRGTGYFDYDATGWTDARYFRLTEAYGFPGVADPEQPIIRAYVDNDQSGWLPRLTYTGDHLTVTGGLELRRHRSLHWGVIQSAASLPASLDPGRRYYEYRGGKDIASAYAQAGWTLMPGTTLQGSLQYVFNRYRLFDEKYVGTDFTVDYSFLNPRLGINVNVNEQWNLYASVNLTRREPRLKNLYDAAESSGGALPQFAMKADSSWDFSRPLVQPERLLNIEAGAGLRRDGLRATVTGFVMDFRDEIVKSGQLDRFGQPMTGNAPQSLHYGIEGEVVVGPWNGLTLEGNGMLSRSRLERYRVYESSETGVVERTLDGNRIAGVPELLANLILRWEGPYLGVNMTVKHVGDQYTDNTQNDRYRVDPSTVVNAGLSLRIPEWVAGTSGLIRLTVTNLFDTLYTMSGEGDQFFPGATRGIYGDVTVHL